MVKCLGRLINLLLYSNCSVNYKVCCCCCCFVFVYLFVYNAKMQMHSMNFKHFNLQRDPLYYNLHTSSLACRLSWQSDNDMSSLNISHFMFFYLHLYLIMPKTTNIILQFNLM